LSIEDHGIREGYPILKKRFGRLVGYVQLCRPFTLIAPLAAGVLGVLAPVGHISFNHLVIAIYVGVTLAFAQACGQCINQYADADLDKIVKKYRAIPSGIISREEALGFAWLLALFAIARAFTVSVFLGLVILILLFFAVFYSLSPFSPRKIHPLLNTGWMALSRGFIPVFAVLSIYGDGSNAWQYGVLAFVWIMGFQSTKDIADSAADRKFGIKTIFNTYGSTGLTMIMIGCSLLYGGLAVLFEMPIMLVLLIVGILAILLKDKTVSFMENNIGWIGFNHAIGFRTLLIF